MLRSMIKKTNFLKVWVSSRPLYHTNNKIKLTMQLPSQPPSKTDTTVGKWFLGCSGMVFVAVGLGGVTRLTESGLSMVTWKLMGEHMPQCQEEWNKEFMKYQQYPEYKIKNANITLEEFKFIYRMEYIHRMWGRAIGGFFLLPAIYFWKKGYFCVKTKRNVLVLGTLIGLQGLMGWYMVKSGLEDRFYDPNEVPRVSQYRLASHLAAAFILYAMLLSNAMTKLIPSKISVSTAKRVLKTKMLSQFARFLVFLTAISGSFVAGLDAGLVYNSFPKMGDKWIPNDILLFKPMLKNISENPTTVQFNHRVLGISTVTLISVLWIMTKRQKLPKRINWAVNALTIMSWIQATLGVTTLLNYVPVPLATAHQSGSLILLTFSAWLSHELRFIRYIPK